MPTYSYACDACGHEFEKVQRISEAATRAVGDPLYAGVDVCVTRRKRVPYVLEVNAFGDLLPRVLVDGRDTYTAEIVAALEAA